MKRTLLLTGLLLTTSLAHAAVNKVPWGKTKEGKPVELFTLTDAALTVRITNYGARIVSIVAPGRDGVKADVVLGYKDVAAYEADHTTYLGSTAGRYVNRIGHAGFTLEGQPARLTPNDGANTLHGGTDGFDRRVWTATEVPNGVAMTLLSPDGDQGFPGALTVHVRYTLEGSSLHIDFSGTTTKPTVVALTNHSYFNLAGEHSGTILNQQLRINASQYLPVDSNLIPLGPPAPVAGTPFDFGMLTAMGARSHDNNRQLNLKGGYDHNYILNGYGMREAAEMVDPASGRTLTISTTEPGIQFYGGHTLHGEFTGLTGKPYEKDAGICLETQHFPDSPNEPTYPSTELKPGETYRSSTVFAFGVMK